MTRPRKVLAWIVGILALLEQIVKLCASLLLLGLALVIVWCYSVPDTFYAAYDAIRGPRE